MIQKIRSNNQLNALIALIIILIPALASASYIDRILVDQHIPLNRFQSVSPSSVCHNNVYIYFRSEQDCLNSDFSPLICKETLKLSPIREAERIQLENKDKSLLRTNKIELNYQKLIYEYAGEGTYNLSTTTESAQIQICEDKDIHEEKVIYSKRETFNNTELSFLSDLYEEGLFWITTGPGPITSIKQIDENSPVMNINRIDRQKLTENIKTPQCNPFISQDWVRQMSGERSGNGITKTTFDFIQRASQELQSDSSCKEPSSIEI